MLRVRVFNLVILSCLAAAAAAAAKMRSPHMMIEEADGGDCCREYRQRMEFIRELNVKIAKRMKQLLEIERRRLKSLRQHTCSTGSSTQPIHNQIVIQLATSAPQNKSKSNEPTHQVSNVEEGNSIQSSNHAEVTGFDINGIDFLKVSSAEIEALLNEAVKHSECEVGKVFVKDKGCVPIMSNSGVSSEAKTEEPVMEIKEITENRPENEISETSVIKSEPELSQIDIEIQRINSNFQVMLKQVETHELRGSFAHELENFLKLELEQLKTIESEELRSILFKNLQILCTKIEQKMKIQQVVRPTRVPMRQMIIRGPKMSNIRLPNVSGMKFRPPRYTGNLNTPKKQSMIIKRPKYRPQVDYQPVKQPTEVEIKINSLINKLEMNSNEGKMKMGVDKMSIFNEKQPNNGITKMNRDRMTINGDKMSINEKKLAQNEGIMSKYGEKMAINHEKMSINDGKMLIDAKNGLKIEGENPYGLNIANTNQQSTRNIELTKEIESGVGSGLQITQNAVDSGNTNIGHQITEGSDGDMTIDEGEMGEMSIGENDGRSEMKMSEWNSGGNLMNMRGNEMSIKGAMMNTGGSAVSSFENIDGDREMNIDGSAMEIKGSGMSIDENGMSMGNGNGKNFEIPASWIRGQNLNAGSTSTHHMEINREAIIKNLLTKAEHNQHEIESSKHIHEMIMNGRDGQMIMKSNTGEMNINNGQMKVKSGVPELDFSHAKIYGIDGENLQTSKVATSQLIHPKNQLTKMYLEMLASVKKSQEQNKVNAANIQLVSNENSSKIQQNAGKSSNTKIDSSESSSKIDNLGMSISNFGKASNTKIDSSKINNSEMTIGESEKSSNIQKYSSKMDNSEMTIDSSSTSGSSMKIQHEKEMNLHNMIINSKSGKMKTRNMEMELGKSLINNLGNKGDNNGEILKLIMQLIDLSKNGKTDEIEMLLQKSPELIEIYKIIQASNSETQGLISENQSSSKENQIDESKMSQEVSKSSQQSSQSSQEATQKTSQVTQEISSSSQESSKLSQKSQISSLGGHKNIIQGSKAHQSISSIPGVKIFKEEIPAKVIMKAQLPNGKVMKVSEHTMNNITAPFEMNVPVPIVKTKSKTSNVQLPFSKMIQKSSKKIHSSIQTIKNGRKSNNDENIEDEKTENRRLSLFGFDPKESKEHISGLVHKNKKEEIANVLKNSKPTFKYKSIKGLTLPDTKRHSDEQETIARRIIPGKYDEDSDEKSQMRRFNNPQIKDETTNENRDEIQELNQDESKESEKSDDDADTKSETTTIPAVNE